VKLAHDVVHDDEALCIVTWGSVVGARWRATPTRATLELLARHQRMLAEATFERRIVAITVVSPGASLILTGDARTAAEAVDRAGSEYLMGLAQVVEGEGFAAATARAVLSGIQLAVRAGYPMKVFSKLEDAMPWVSMLLRKAGQHRDADEATDAMLEALG
jgi:hypothetical protein